VRTMINHISTICLKRIGFSKECGIKEEEICVPSSSDSLPGEDSDSGKSKKEKRIWFLVPGNGGWSPT